MSADSGHSAEARAFVSRLAAGSGVPDEHAFVRELRVVLDDGAGVEYGATDPVPTSSLLATYSRRYDHARGRGHLETRNIVGFAETVDRLRSTDHTSLRVVSASAPKRLLVIFATRALDHVVAWIALDYEHPGPLGRRPRDP